MYEWNEIVQKMINWIEQNIDSDSVLHSLSQYTGYSPYYCSNQFHLVTGMTIREYITKRRVSKAAIELRDTNNSIIDIAIKFGFSSQEAFTRAFNNRFGVTPKKYRIKPTPIPLAFKQEVFAPQHYLTSGLSKSSYEKKIVEIKIEVIPKHRFIGIWDINAQSYYQFFNNRDCDEICGTIESMAHLTLSNQLTHTAGWYYEGDRRGYFYGVPVSANYNGPIPRGMKCKEIPELNYLCFYHPPFSYLEHNKKVMDNVEKVASSFNPQVLGHEYNNSYHIYQKHHPEMYGYSILAPLKN